MIEIYCKLTILPLHKSSNEQPALHREESSRRLFDSSSRLKIVIMNSFSNFQQSIHLIKHKCSGISIREVIVNFAHVSLEKCRLLSLIAYEILKLIARSPSDVL